jgi:hypothetical protein
MDVCDKLECWFLAEFIKPFILFARKALGKQVKHLSGPEL